MVCGGRPAVVTGINVVGLRRAGISSEVREEIKKAYKILYRSGLNVSQALEEMAKNFKSDEVKHLINFIRDSKRGILDGAARPQENADEEYQEETLKPRKSFPS